MMTGTTVNVRRASLRSSDDEDHERPDQRQGRLEERHDAVGHEVVERLDVVRHPRDQHAGRPTLVEADRHLLQVVEDRQSQVGERTLADPLDEVGLRVGRHPDDACRDDEGDHDERQRPLVAGRDPVVDRQLGQRGRRQGRGGPDDQRREHRDHAPAVRPQQGEQAAQPAAAAAGPPQPAADVAEPRGSQAGPLRLGAACASGRRWSGRPFSTISR